MDYFFSKKRHSMFRVTSPQYQVVNSAGSNEDCSICLEPHDRKQIVGHREVRQQCFWKRLRNFFQGDQVEMVHKVHSACINRWIETNGSNGHVSCPSCRERIYIDVMNSPFLTREAIQKLAHGAISVGQTSYYTSPMGGWIVPFSRTYTSSVFIELHTFRGPWPSNSLPAEWANLGSL